jgi:hypothetical protein
MPPLVVGVGASLPTDDEDEGDDDVDFPPWDEDDDRCRRGAPTAGHALGCVHIASPEPKPARRAVDDAHARSVTEGRVRQEESILCQPSARYDARWSG